VAGDLKASALFDHKQREDAVASSLQLDTWIGFADDSPLEWSVRLSSRIGCPSRWLGRVRKLV
jgi:hypothetical protein